MLHQGAADQILDLLESDEALGPRILQLHRQGFFEKDAAAALDEKLDGDAPFARGTTHHNKLTLRSLDYLFREMGLQPETVDSICSKSKLQSCRWLWCWFNDCEMQDKLPATSLNSLLSWSLQRQSEFDSSRLEAFVLDEDDSIDWLKTGIYVVSFEEGVTTIEHRPSNINLVNPACFNGASQNWTIDGNYSTKCAKLKNLDNGAVFPLAGLFRENGHVLSARLKSTKISPRARPALSEVLQISMADSRPTQTTSRTSDAAPVSSRTSNGMTLTQGADGRFRLQSSTSPRLAEPASVGTVGTTTAGTGASVNNVTTPSPHTKGLAAKSRARPEGTAEYGHVRPKKLHFQEETDPPPPMTPPRGKKTRDTLLPPGKGNQAKSLSWSYQTWEDSDWADWDYRAPPSRHPPARRQVQVSHADNEVNYSENDLYAEDGEEEFLGPDDEDYETGEVEEGTQEVVSTTLHHRQSRTTRRANWHSITSPPQKRRRILRRNSSTGSVASSDK